MDRRALLAGSAAGLWAASARAQQACFDRMDCFDTQLPGPSLDLQFTGGSLDPRITFTRASVASYFDVAGTLQSAASGARFDYDPVTHAPRGLLIEEARTNLLLNSATLGTQSVTVTAAATTLSFYGTGTVTLSGTFAGSLIGSGAFPTRSTLTFTPTAGSLTCTVTGSVLNAQVETGAFATSWVSTAGTTATRAADVATMPVGAWFNPAASTQAAEWMMPAVPANTFPTIMQINNGAEANTAEFFFFGGQLHADMKVSGATLIDASVIAQPIGTPAKVAFAYTANYQGIAANGSAPLAFSNATIPGGITTVFIGSAPGGSSLNGYIRRIRYWPRAMAAAELQGTTR